MTSPAASYHGYRFPPEIISHAVWLYHRFCLSVCVWEIAPYAVTLCSPQRRGTEVTSMSDVDRSRKYRGSTPIFL